jgi:hypothetical protein
MLGDCCNLLFYVSFRPHVFLHYAKNIVITIISHVVSMLGVII